MVTVILRDLSPSSVPQVMLSEMHGITGISRKVYPVKRSQPLSPEWVLLARSPFHFFQTLRRCTPTRISTGVFHHRRGRALESRANPAVIFFHTTNASERISYIVICRGPR